MEGVGIRIRFARCVPRGLPKECPIPRRPPPPKRGERRQRKALRCRRGALRWCRALLVRSSYPGRSRPHVMTFAVVHSRALRGLQAPAVTVEVHLANGLPTFTLVGLADTEVKEARER